ncbi:MAG: glycosyltransferase [Tenuifilaceae bacterium]|nr:glycosyltransferase [Tenuifilaceae bacterium]
MNILVLANKIPYPPRDGGALATYNMIVGLAMAGAQVTLLAMRTPKHSGFLGWEADVGMQKSIEIKAVDVNTRISPVKALANLLFSDKPYNAERFVSREYRIALEHFLTQKHYDMVQLEGLYLTPYIGLIRERFGGPIALRAHNVEWEIWQRASENQSNPIKRWYFSSLANRIRVMEKEALRQIDWLIPITARDAQMLQQMGYHGKVFVSQVGYNLSLAADDEVSSDFEHPSIFHLGGLDWLPNQEGVIWFLKHCWPLVLAKFPSARFYVAGRNAPRWLVKQMLHHPNVTYCGEVSSAIQFMQSKGIMVVPILTGSGMRVKIVEGMALGKAIVSTTIGAEGIDAQHGKQLHIADSPDDFVNAIETLLHSKQSIVEMGTNAKAYAHTNFDNQTLTAHLLKFYAHNLQK